MLRRLFMAVAVISLLLFVASVVLWVRSYRPQRDSLLIGAENGRVWEVQNGGLIHPGKIAFFTAEAWTHPYLAQLTVNRSLDEYQPGEFELDWVWSPDTARTEAALGL